MKIDGWKYYNHAAIPTTAPHETPDISPIADGSIWKIRGGTPLLARWTTEFDCGYETNWWYVIKDAPYDINDVSKKNQKSIRQALKKCYVKRIEIANYTDDLWECYSSAHSRYKNADNCLGKDVFINGCDPQLDWWAGFDCETDKMIGWFNVRVYDAYVEIQSAKFHAEFMQKQVSDALYHYVLDYYLNVLKKEYVSSGFRSINHKTNTQEYKIRRFGYRKAYCRLHIQYNPKIRVIIKLLFPFRKALKLLDKITIMHQIKGILKMEEIYREENAG